LSEELELHHTDGSGDMEDRIDRLYERLKPEKELESVMDKIDHLLKTLQTLVPTMKSIPCSLHSEIRIAINILTMIFSMGIDNRDSKKEQEAFYQKLSKLVYTKVLGTDRIPTQWVVPITV
jgi:hypothetical protein